MSLITVNAYPKAAWLSAVPATAGIPSDADYVRMMNRRAKDLAIIAQDLASGEITIQQFGEQFDSVLLKGHTDSWVLGRQRAGDTRSIVDADKIAGLAAKDAESQWLNPFLDDLIRGRYTDEDGEYRLGAIRARMNLYLGKMRATSAEAFIEASGPDEEYIWHLVAEDHCDDCPRIAVLSPFKKDTLVSIPGGGDTECLGNCKCFLSRSSDSRTSFAAVPIT